MIKNVKRKNLKFMNIIFIKLKKKTSINNEFYKIFYINLNEHLEKLQYFFKTKNFLLNYFYFLIQ